MVGARMRTMGSVTVLALLLFAYPPIGMAAEEASATKKNTAKPHVLIEKDCPEELEFKSKLKAGIREANLAIYPLAAIAVSKEAKVIAEDYWNTVWNTFVDGARKRAHEAGVLKKHTKRSEGFDTRSDLGKLCSAVASRDVGMCDTPTVEQRTRCLLQVGLYSDCSVAGPYAAVCRVIKDPASGSCESLGGPKETCQNLARVRQSLSHWCGQEGDRKETPECLGAMAVHALATGRKTCASEPGLEKLTPICNAMVEGKPEACGASVSTLSVGDPMTAEERGLPAVQSWVEGSLVGTADGQRALLLWAGATRKALCHVDARIMNADGREVASVQDVIRVLGDEDTDSQQLVPLASSVDVFTASVKLKFTCTGRYWW